jgi:hypothetical protein
MKAAKGQNILTLLLGIWLFITPWIMNYSLFVNNESAVNWNFWSVGVIVIVSTALALRDLRPWEEWANIGLGAWLFLSPWALGFSQNSGLFWNAVLSGAAIMVLSAAALPVAQRLVHQKY